MLVLFEVWLPVFRLSGLLFLLGCWLDEHFLLFRIYSLRVLADLLCLGRPGSVRQMAACAGKKCLLASSWAIGIKYFGRANCSPSINHTTGKSFVENGEFATSILLRAQFDAPCWRDCNTQIKAWISTIRHTALPRLKRLHGQ